MKIKVFVFLLWAIHPVLFAQVTSIGQWRTHFAYQQGLAVTLGNNGQVYCATNGGLFSYNPADNSFSMLSKINGFSELSVNAVNFDNVSNTLLVAYSDANIDIVQNGKITNLPDIKNANIPGSKAINNIFFSYPYAYLACGFGIVVINIPLNETADTYYIGQNGMSVNVLDVNSDGDTLYAATSSGIYVASLNNTNLADYNNWNLQGAGLPADHKFNTMVYFNGKMYANNSVSPSPGNDQVYEKTGSTWVQSPVLNADNYKRLRVKNNQLIVAANYSVKVYDANENQIANYNNYGFNSGGNSGVDYPLLSDGLVDNNNFAWIADGEYGLVKMPLQGISEKLVPNGPHTQNVYGLAYSTGTVWLVPGGVTGSWSNSFIRDGVSYFSGNNWTSIYGNVTGVDMDTIFDPLSVAIDSLNPNHAFVGTWGKGMLEFNNAQFVKQYNSANQPAISNNIAGVAFDESKNLWMSCSLTGNILAVKKQNGSWTSMNFASILNQSLNIKDPSYMDVGNMIVSKYTGQKWIILPRSNAIMVYNDNGTFAQPCTACPHSAPANAIVIASGTGKGALPGALVSCLAEDQNGAIWIGTDQGIVVENNPSGIFSGGGYDAQPIYVQQNGYTQLLFQSEYVSAIAVDGANRKWCGTQSAGVFLMSADGTTQIYNFTTSNSPLPSNNVVSIAINGLTGEVFFGTQAGVVSYKSTSTDGSSQFGDVYAYPNPVKHTYTGLIAIKNLTADADVRITDITGTLIFKTTALGGQAIWDGNNFSGERAHTGVYLVFCTSSDGTQTHMTKILFIN